MSANEAIIVGAEMAAGHDGLPELVLRLRHPGGSENLVVLEEELGLALMARCGALHVDQLVNHSWQKIVEVSNDV